MPKTKYRFNKRSLRFEIAGIPWISYGITLLGVFILAGAFFVGLVLLQNRIIESEYESQLRLENAALKKHKDLIQSEIKDANVLLASLIEEDNKLHKRIFLTDKEGNKSSLKFSIAMLESNDVEFNHVVSQVSEKATSTNRKANFRNSQLAQLYWPKKQDVEDFGTYPTRAPLQNFTTQSLACGFGEQVNPFNKLLYQHLGLDLVADRGTPIIAPGNGKVILIQTSELPAGYGNLIEIDHGNGYRTRFAHLEAIHVQRGQKIKKGDIIGTVGISGGAVAPHIHYEISLNGKELNPILFMIDGFDESFHHELLTLAKKVNQSLD